MKELFARLSVVVALFVLTWLNHAPYARAQQATAASTTAELTAAANESLPVGGKKSLFNGKSIANWIQIPPDSWIIEEGAMASRGAGRGVIYTKDDYSHYRLLFTMRHVSGKPDHHACVLVFCTRPTEGQRPFDALAGVQFQPPLGGHWDYRKGHNNSGKGLFTRIVKPNFHPHKWSRVEILVNAAQGTARMAVAQPVGSKAIEVLTFSDPTAGRPGPIAWQMHNEGLFDEYKDVEVEINPSQDELITVK